MTLQSRMLLFLLTSLVLPSARGACQSWSHNLTTPKNSVAFQGTLGTRPIRMMLHLDEKTGHIEGAYGDNEQPGMKTLTGAMSIGDTGVALIERNAQRRVTGQFSLSFFRPRPPGESVEKYEKERATTCDFLMGSWHPVSKSQAQQVALQVSGEIDPADDEARLKNEHVAYQLKQAMLNNDRVAFASLLRYPFHTVRGQQFVGLYRRPDDVIRHYKEIMLFQYSDIRDAVPHVLQTSGKTTQFMTRSVIINSGKVLHICDGACPVQPY